MCNNRCRIGVKHRRVSDTMTHLIRKMSVLHRLCPFKFQIVQLWPPNLTCSILTFEVYPILYFANPR